jgi:putative transposase
MDKYQNKYRIPSTRAAWWNYAGNGVYFITICTAGREYYFGEIKNGVMILSVMGCIVQQEWDKSFEIRTELFCDTFVIMPNHIHAILRIENNDPNVGTHGRAPLPIPIPTPQQPQSHGVAFRLPKSISSFVAGFKSVATKRINEFREMPKSPVWQSRFYDRIIRNDAEYNRIKKYILDNPQKWDKDKLFQNE